MSEFCKNFLIGIALDLWVNLKRVGILITLDLPIRGPRVFLYIQVTSEFHIWVRLIPRFLMVSVPIL